MGTKLGNWRIKRVYFRD